MSALRQTVKRLSDRWILPTSGNVSIRDLNQRFQPVPPGSLRSLLLKMNLLADVAKPVGGSTHPYYCRSKPTPQRLRDFASDRQRIDLTNAHLPSFGEPHPVDEAIRLFDKRAAAVISAAVGLFQKPLFTIRQRDLLETKYYSDDSGDVAPIVWIPVARCLALMAYPDYFPEANAEYLRSMVSKAILEANPGWCGTFGPGVDGAFDVAGDFFEGNYDMSQMHLVQIAYRYYDELKPDAREHLITQLLARGRVHRPGCDDTFTSGGTPGDWSRAGFISPLGVHQRIGETENHILTILTTRYLTNQLMYQRDPVSPYDNRRNGAELDGPNCTDLLLSLLRNILRDDFSEYNAKNYQIETRQALLNLCSYAYDHEVRLAAQMVLDYVSAHMAVSSNDLRRMVPFRRRNEGKNVTQLPPPAPGGVLDVGLVEWQVGADPMAEPFAIQAGNTRIYERRNDELLPPDFTFHARPWDWSIAGSGDDSLIEALSDYRLPSSIHDLFVTDFHRRFFQKLHRTPQDNMEETGRNCDNHEIYAASPSYLITAGGSPATYAIDPGLALISAKGRRKSAQQLGVAVTTSFMPTTAPNLGIGNPNRARDLIQLGSFSSEPGKASNYGVAPDFACGHMLHFPQWCSDAIGDSDHRGNFTFVNKGGSVGGPGFYLALWRWGSLTALEAFDTWLHPDVTYAQFRERVIAQNPLNERLSSNVEARYTTYYGTRLRFLIWDGSGEEDGGFGARVLEIEQYSHADPMDSLGDAGNRSDAFLSGTVMNSSGDGDISITNHFLRTSIRLDMRTASHPRRTVKTPRPVSETASIAEAAFNEVVEEAGSKQEVWVNFGWTGPGEGDFFRPFNTIAAAAAAVADGGLIKIMPGWTTERPFLAHGKRMKLVAPIGGVTFGVR